MLGLVKRWRRPAPAILSTAFTDDEARDLAALCLEGLSDEAAAAARSRMEASGEDYAGMQVAYFLERSAGGRPAAAAFLSRLADLPAFRGTLLYRAGALYSASNDPVAALEQLQHGIVEGLFGTDGIILTAYQNARLGHAAEAARLLSIADTIDPAQRVRIQADRDFFAFLAAFPREAAEHMFEALSHHHPRATWQQIEQDASRSLADCRPYLLLRMGDGEGSCLVIDEADARTYATLYAANRAEFYEIWFRDTAVEKAGGFGRAIALFNDAVATADCIGGVYREAIDKEYGIASRRGITWIVNAMRKIAGSGVPVPICDLTIHYELLLNGSLTRLLRSAASIGLISCHVELAAALEAKFHLPSIDFIKVPGEQLHAGVLGAHAVKGAHWPDRFDEICEICSSRDRRGQLFLVAAGLLGKVYAARLKNAGAVVLDIGAVADLWMGKATRDFFPVPSAEHMLDG